MNSIRIGNMSIQTGGRVCIIAEAGVNHNGSLRIAKKLVDAAKYAGADAVKFQTFKPEDLVTEKAAMAAYQKKNIGEIGSQLAMLKNLELDYSAFSILKQYCDRKKNIIPFHSSY